MIVKIDADFIKNLKNFIANNPVTQVAFNDGSGYEYPCMLSIGNELLWEGSHNSSDWIIDNDATISSMGHKHKECTECGKVLEEEASYAPDEYYEQYFTFYWKSDTSYSIEVKEGVTLVGEIYIPESYKGKPITHIENEAFKDCTRIIKITIPKSITHIGDGAFKDCSQLANVVFAENSQLTYIGAEAFYDCDSLTEIVIPDSVTFIGGGAFWYCSDLTSVVIGHGVTTIDYGAFGGCTSLAYVYYNGTAKEWSAITMGIYNNTLTDAKRYYYAKTKPPTEGDYWRYVDGRPVAWCYHKEVVIDEAVEPTCTETGLTEGSHCAICGEVLVAQEVVPVINHKWSNWTLDETTGLEYGRCEMCGTYAVRAGSGVEGDIVIPATYNGKPVTHIANYAFAYNSYLTSVVIGNNITTIGDAAFLGCSRLTNVVISDSVTIIGVSAFQNCIYLPSIEIPNSVTSIKGAAFANCWSLTNVVIPGSVTFIGGQAFSECNSLTSVVIGNGVTTISSVAFENCPNLTSITIPDSVTSIGRRALEGTAYYNDENNWINGILYCGNHLIKAKDDITGEREIREGTLTIADDAFYLCHNLTEVTIPDSVTSMGELAFSECSSLTSVAIPNSVTSIGYSAFSDCTSLTSIVIPDSVTSIGEVAFGRCSSLASVSIGKGVTYMSGAMFADCVKITEIVIPSNVTSIGNSAFADCDRLKKVTFEEGSNCSYIDDYAFFYCTKLTNLAIPASVTSIGDRPFWGCKSLVISVEEGNTSYYTQDGYLKDSNGTIIFANRDADIPTNTTAINSGAFTGTYAAPIKIPLSVAFVESLAFYECENLVLHVEAPSKPAGWADDWCDDTVTVVWGYVEDTSTYLVTEDGYYLTDENGNLLVLEGNLQQIIDPIITYDGCDGEDTITHYFIITNNNNFDVTCVWSGGDYGEGSTVTIAAMSSYGCSVNDDLSYTDFKAQFIYGNLSSNVVSGTYE